MEKKLANVSVRIHFCTHLHLPLNFLVDTPCLGGHLDAIYTSISSWSAHGGGKRDVCCPSLLCRRVVLSCWSFCARTLRMRDYMDHSDIVFPLLRAQYLPRSPNGGPATAFRVCLSTPSLVPVWGVAGPLHLSVFTRTAELGTMRASGLPWPPFVRNSSSGVIVAGSQWLFA